jgi:predicted membrane chloride channel (bestrophin family)
MVTFNITSSTLGLLLVFRTNASYGRWDEARKIWGLMVNRTRSGRAPPVARILASSPFIAPSYALTGEGGLLLVFSGAET